MEFLTVQRKIAATSWASISTSLNQWQGTCLNTITLMVCCAFCASVAFGGSYQAKEYTLMSSPANL
jgi:hypothetical protein